MHAVNQPVMLECGMWKKITKITLQFHSMRHQNQFVSFCCSTQLESHFTLSPNAVCHNFSTFVMQEFGAFASVSSIIVQLTLSRPWKTQEGCLNMNTIYHNLQTFTVKVNIFTLYTANIYSV